MQVRAEHSICIVLYAVVCPHMAVMCDACHVYTLHGDAITYICTSCLRSCPFFQERPSNAMLAKWHVDIHFSQTGFAQAQDRATLKN